MSKYLLSIFVSCFLVGHVSAQVPQNAVADDYNSFFKTVKWRSIGPFRGGGSNFACGGGGDARTYYMGTTGGGLWKTDDMGISWRNVSDGFFKTGSVGAVAVAGSDPNGVYVGMGKIAGGGGRGDDLPRRRRVQINRRGKDLEEDRIGSESTHFACRHRS